MPDAKELRAETVELTVRAHIRHAHTRYDEILSRGAERHETRARVSEVVAKRLDEWSYGKS